MENLNKVQLGMTFTRAKNILIIFLLGLGAASCKKVHISLAEPVPEATPIFHTYDGQLGISDNSAIVSYDGNIVICGNLDHHILVFKISKNGDLIWKKMIGGVMTSVASGIAETKDHQLVICGYTDMNYNQSRADIMVVKMSEAGDSLWTKTFGGTENDTGYSITGTSDGNMLVAAKTESFDAYDPDLYLVKIDMDGKELWAKKYYNEGTEVPVHVMETKEGGYLVTGTSKDYNPQFNLYLFKVNSAGNYLWKNSVFGNIWGYSTVESANGDLLTCGGGPALNNNVFLHKTNSSGATLWEQVLNTNGEFINAFSMKENPDHSFDMTGYFKPSPNAKKIILFMKIDNNGKSLLMRKFGEPINNEGLNLVKDKNGDNLIIGRNDKQIFFTRLGTDGKFK
jgi:hypothetical protein